jgi:hypothetical protein
MEDSPFSFSSLFQSYAVRDCSKKVMILCAGWQARPNPCDAGRNCSARATRAGGHHSGRSTGHNTGGRLGGQAAQYDHRAPTVAARGNDSRTVHVSRPSSNAIHMVPFSVACCLPTPPFPFTSFSVGLVRFVLVLLDPSLPPRVLVIPEVSGCNESERLGLKLLTGLLQSLLSGPVIALPRRWF